MTTFGYSSILLMQTQTDTCGDAACPHALCRDAHAVKDIRWKNKWISERGIKIALSHCALFARLPLKSDGSLICIQTRLCQINDSEINLQSQWQTNIPL